MTLVQKLVEKKIREEIAKAKGKEVIVLVNNPLDMSRWRSWFHRWSQSDVLLSVQFLDIKNFIRKKSAVFHVLEYSPVSPLQLEHLLKKMIENKEMRTKLSHIENILDFPGSIKKILELYSSWHWHDNLEEVLKQCSLSKEQEEYFNSLVAFFKDIDKHLKTNKLLHEAVYFQMLKQNIAFHNKDSIVFWMFPFHLDIQSYKKLLRLQELQLLSWFVFLFEKQEEIYKNKLYVFLDTLKKQKRLTLEAIPFVNILEDKSQKELSATLLERIKIFSGNNTEAEVTFITRYTKKLLEEGNGSENILILYSHNQLAYSLRNSFLMNRIPIDIPMKINWQQTNLGKFFFLFFKILGSLPLHNQDYFDFFTSQFLKQRNSFRKRVLENSSFFYEDLMYGESTLKNFIEKSKKQVTNMSTAQKPSVERTLKGIELFEKKFSLLQEELLASEWINEVRKKIEEYMIDGGSLSNIFYKEFLNHLKALSRLFDQYQNLDFVYPQKIKKKAFFKSLLNDITNTFLNKTGDDPLDKDLNNHARVFVRHINEGIGSLVDYAFICGLSENYFPKQANGGEILENPFLQKQLNWFSKSEEDVFLLEQSLKMVQKKAILTYASNSSHGPSRIIFSLLKKMYPQKKEKQELLSHVPVLYYTMGKYPSWQNKKEEKENFLPKLPLLSKEAVKKPIGHFEKKDNMLDEYYALAYKKYQAEIFDKNNEIYLGKISQKLNLLNEKYSYTQIERLTNCPQKFFFSKILHLKKFASSGFSTELSSLKRGSFFHEVAQNFFNTLQNQFENLTYGEISLRHSKEQWYEDIKKAIEMIYKTYKNLNFVEKEMLQKEEAKVITYFSLFFNKMTIDENRNYQVYKVEWRFDDVLWEDINLTGQIDRIDIDHEAKKILIIDYKTGGSFFATKAKEKWSYIPSAQLAIYLFALAQKLPKLLPNWQEYSIAAKYVYVFDSAKEVGFTNEKTSTKEKFFIAKQENLSHALFESYTFQETNEFLTSAQLIKQLIEEQSFFSVYDKEKENSPCRYCDFRFICDGYGKINKERTHSGKIYRQFAETFLK